MAKKKKKTKRKLAHPKLPMQRQLNLRHEGTHFDLRAIFNDLNERYFRGRLRGYNIMWGRRRKHRPKEHFIFGTIQEEDRVIRINPALDQPFVPLWFSALRALSRDAAFGCAGSKAISEPPTSSHRRIQSARARVSAVPAGATLGRRKSVAFFALTHIFASPAKNAPEGQLLPEVAG